MPEFVQYFGEHLAGHAAGVHLARVRMRSRRGHDEYLKWSNTSDAPVSCVMSREEITRNLEEDHLPYEQAIHLLDLADQTETSDPTTDLATLLDQNCAGPDEGWLSKNEILRAYRAPD